MVEPGAIKRWLNAVAMRFGRVEKRNVNISSNTSRKNPRIERITIQFIFPKCISHELNNRVFELEIWEEGDFYVRH
jgi:hypothetical protein